MYTGDLFGVFSWAFNGGSFSKWVSSFGVDVSCFAYWISSGLRLGSKPRRKGTTGGWIDVFLSQGFLGVFPMFFWGFSQGFLGFLGYPVFLRSFDPRPFLWPFCGTYFWFGFSPVKAVDVTLLLLGRKTPEEPSS